MFPATLAPRTHGCYEPTGVGRRALVDHAWSARPATPAPSGCRSTKSPSHGMFRTRRSRSASLQEARE